MSVVWKFLHQVRAGYILKIDLVRIVDMRVRVCVCFCVCVCVCVPEAINN